MGLTLDWSTPVRLRVVAVVGDILDDGYDATAEPAFFVPFGMLPARRMSYLVGTTGDPVPVIAAVREAIERIDPDIPAGELRLLDGMMAETVVRPRAASLIGLALACLALLVAGAGIYGVLSGPIHKYDGIELRSPSAILARLANVRPWIVFRADASARAPLHRAIRRRSSSE